jgi:hypothetical protein
MSSAMNEAFGNFPDRPDHPDFWKLSEIVLGLDGAIEEAERTGGSDVFHDLATEHCDLRSQLYMATQRVQRFLLELGPVDGAMLAASAWIDGFQVGVRFGRK